MGFQVSPGVEVKEIDLTNVIPAVSTSIGGFAGYFRWGPVNEIGLVSSEKELAGKFGSPDAAHTQSFLTAASFLKYGNALKVVRAGNSALLNAVAGTHEVLNGGIEGIALNSVPTEFSTGITATTGLHVIETDGEGTGAVIEPRFDVNSAVTTAGYQLTDIDPSTLSDGSYTATVQGQSVSFTVATGTATIDTPVYFPEDPTGSITVTDTVASPDVDVTDVVLTGTAVTFTSSATGASPAGDFVDGEVLTVYTTSGDDTSVSFTISVTDNAGSPEFAIAAGVTDVSLFDEFPASTDDLQVFRADGTVVNGLFVDAEYEIAAIVSTADGTGYVIANTTIGISPDGNVANAVSVDPSNFTFDEQETEFSSPTFIANEEAFESIYPATTDAALPGLLFAKYAGELGNSLGAYIIDAASWSATSSDVQGNFDAAPEGTEVHVLVYDITGAITGQAGQELEKWSFLERTAGAKAADGSNNNYQDVINANSNYIYIARPTIGSATPYAFTGGADVVEAGAVEAGDITAGLDILADVETVDVNLLFAQNEVSGSTVSNHLMTIASSRKDAVAFVSPPISASTGNDPLTDVKNSIGGLPRGIEGSYGVFDSTALYVYNKYADNYVWIPACGHVAGLCAKTDDLAEPWFSPAGYNRGGLLGVTKLAFNPKQAERDELYKAGINPIVSFPGQGILLFGDKTAQAKPSAFDRINVRRLFIVLEKAIATAAKYQLFELNDEFTRAMFRNMTEPFLRDVKGRRGITDFLVVCDETNNTGEVIDTNRFVADIYIKPARSINFITLNFIATRTGVEFSEIVGK
jgi:phage tail sheath protein FI